MHWVYKLERKVTGHGKIQMHDQFSFAKNFDSARIYFEVSWHFYVFRYWNLFSVIVSYKQHYH